MSKPIKCPSCNVNMEIRSNLVEGHDEYSAKVVCPSCDSRFCPVLGHNEASARRLTAKKTREWIAKLKTCESAGHCALQSFEQYEAIKLLPTPPPAPRSIPQGMVIYGCGMPDTVVMYMASGPSVTYNNDATVTTTDCTTSVVKMSVDELMDLRSRGLLSDTEVTESEDRIIKEFEKSRKD